MLAAAAGLAGTVALEAKKKKKRKKKCKPEPAATTCAGQCGSITNNCKKVVDCGVCVCTPPCGACFACDASRRSCVPAASYRWSAETTFGSSGPSASQFYAPFSVVVSADELTAWVADSDNARISVWTRPATNSASWSNLTTFGSYGPEIDQFRRPTGLALSADELTVWVVDEDAHRISVWTRPDAASAAWTHQATFGSGGNEADQFVSPTNVAVADDALTAWVADGGNDRISVWTRPDAGSNMWSFQTTFAQGGPGVNARQTPYGIAISPDSLTMWATEFDKDRVSVWTRPNMSSSAWVRQTTFGSRGADLNQLAGPRGIAASSDGLTVWVADSINERIAVWTRPTASSTNWSGLATFGSQGPGLNQFDLPSGVSVSANKKTVWVADPYNARIAIWGLSCPA